MRARRWSKTTDENIESTPVNIFPTCKPPPVSSENKQLYRSKQSNNNSLELFIDTIEKEIFNPSNIRRTRNNLSKDEKTALKEIKSWEDKVIRVQDKGSRFVILNTDDYVEKVEHQINRSSFCRLEEDPSNDFKQNVNVWLDKWPDLLTDEWKNFIKPEECDAGKKCWLLNIKMLLCNFGFNFVRATSELPNKKATNLPLQMNHRDLEGATFHQGYFILMV